MTETVYEQKQTEQKAAARTVQLPRNRKQVGQPERTELEIFVEDYVWMFARQLSEQDYTGCSVGILLGERMTTESGKKLLVRGMVEAKGAFCRDTVSFTEEIWAESYRDMKEYFPGQEIVGWFLGGPGFLLAAEEKLKKVQIDHFGGADKVLLKMDSMEKEESLWYYRDGLFHEFSGYYLYYEKNPEMQRYLVKEQSALLAGEQHTQEEEARRGRVALLPGPTDRHASPFPKQPSLYRLLYACGGLAACIAVLAIASFAVQSKERKELERLLSEQEKGAVAANAPAYGTTGEDAPVGAGDAPSGAGGNGEASGGASNGASGNDAPGGANGGNGEASGGALNGASGNDTSTGAGDAPGGANGGNGELSGGAPNGASGNGSGESSAGAGGNAGDAALPAGGVPVQTQQRSYMVQPGDTLASICMKFYGTTERLEEVMRINGLEDRDRINAGQVLKLP